jgi:hypothetical protein
VALVQKLKQLQGVVVGFEIYTQDFAYCENFAPEPIWSPSQLIGHSKINMVMRYARPTQSHQRLEQFNLERQMEEMNEKVPTKVPTLIN